ncbi:MAG: tRNA (N(6)-L-threonylcarbamoyladenosine(37)-C(2))-methylthiotransferase MtaB, partial [Gammaproteobacteria bacterium]|nr:tRNA (N(6)-L-threonylcarbamoyladenosine(37)-C(2))-methylthiotransferase MtaB [Gammaproteobacteria bacterium]
MRVHFQMLGCRLNEAELQGWVRDFTAAGHEVVDASAEADLVVFNTCAVTAEAVRKSRRMIRRARRANPAARLVVTGCYGTLERDEAGALLGVDRVVDNRDKHDLLTRVAPAAAPGERGAVAVAPPRLGRGRDRAFVKVQDGCRHRCSYCVVTLARGEERSRPVAELVGEVAALHASGVNEVVLTGVHVGGYGSDTGGSLAGLVAALLADTDLPRLRLASLEPWAIDDALLACYADTRLLPHLHLPLQSGSDRVLRRMARRCRRDAFRALVARVRDAVPGIHLTTDVIAGFPGEREADWRESLALVEEIAFGDLHVFPFSPRDGTRAATLSDPVPTAVRRRRAAEMQALGDRLRRTHLEAQVGRVAAVLLEGEAGASPAAGYTP